MGLMKTFYAELPEGRSRFPDSGESGYDVTRFSRDSEPDILYWLRNFRRYEGGPA